MNFRLTSGQTSGEKKIEKFDWLKRTAVKFQGASWGSFECLTSSSGRKAWLGWAVRFNLNSSQFTYKFFSLKELVTKTIIETVENHNLPVNNRINHEIAAIQEIHFYMVSVLWCVTGDNIIFSPVTLKSYRVNISSPSYNVSETYRTRLETVTLSHS